MRRSIPFLLAGLVLAPLALTAAPRALAEDEANDQSPAAKAYRDAWWAETGGGNLNQAIEGYTLAIAAEGPASVKARALYRKAVVLQRIGKTEEAIRTLERLAKDHPGEAALQTDARARLAEWTAVDLKTSFAEWYERYQYSPEFQAKIVDLVLKLGSADQAVGTAASQELLTIGAPTIPALRRHVDSSNPQVREHAVTSLLKLGAVPPLAAMRTTTLWRDQAAAWETLRRAGTEDRARLKSEALGDQTFDQGMRALLDGPVAVVKWAGMATEPKVATPFVNYGFGRELDEATRREVRPLLIQLVENRALDAKVRLIAAGRLLWGLQGLDTSLAESWATADDLLLREYGVYALVDGRKDAEAIAALRRVLRDAATWEKNNQQVGNVIRGVLAQLGEFPIGEEFDRLAEDLLATGAWNQVPYTDAAARRVSARMIDRTSSPDVSDSLWHLWQQTGGSRSDVDQLVAWVHSAPTERLRDRAIDYLSQRADLGAQAMLTLLGDQAIPDQRQGRVVAGLLQSHSNLLADPHARRKILATIRSLDAKGGQIGAGLGDRVFDAASAHPQGAQLLTADWLTDPASFPRSVIQRQSQSIWANVRPTLAADWMKAWAAWTPEQRDAAVESLQVLIMEPELVNFLRAAIRDPANGISSASRRAILAYLRPRELAELQIAFDLSTPTGADGALRFLIVGQGGPAPGETTPEWFDALKLGIRPDAAEDVAGAFAKAFKGEPRVAAPLIAALLAHQSIDIQSQAIALLAVRESVDDLPLWLKALALPSPDVRARAAAGLGRVPHPDVTKALVAALDDPSSRVRDAATASLEAIQKVEDLKKAWREKAEGLR